MIGALPGIVEGLRRDGATLVRVDDLDAVPALGESVDERADGGGAA